MECIINRRVIDWGISNTIHLSFVHSEIQIAWFKKNMHSKLYKLQQYEQMKSIIIKTSCISNKNKVVTNMYFWLCTTSVKSSVNKNILRCVLTIYAVNYFSNYNVYKLMLLLRVIPHWMSVVKIYKRTRLTVLC